MSAPAISKRSIAASVSSRLAELVSDAIAVVHISSQALCSGVKISSFALLTSAPIIEQHLYHQVNRMKLRFARHNA